MCATQTEVLDVSFAYWIVRSIFERDAQRTLKKGMERVVLDPVLLSVRMAQRANERGKDGAAEVVLTRGNETAAIHAPMLSKPFVYRKLSAYGELFRRHGHIPSTIKESFPSVRLAFLPTFNVDSPT